jgi:hypothetical protein
MREIGQGPSVLSDLPHVTTNRWTPMLDDFTMSRLQRLDGRDAASRLAMARALALMRCSRSQRRLQGSAVARSRCNSLDDEQETSHT